MYHRRFYLYIVLIILSIVLPIVICTINDYPLAGLYVFLSFFAVIIMYSSDKKSSCKLYQNRMNKYFDNFINNKQYKRAEQFLKENNKHCFGVYYYYSMSMFDIKGDPYRGYPKVFTIRDNAYITLYIASKQYDKAYKYIIKKRDFVKNKYYYELFLLELFFNKNTNTIALLQKSEFYSLDVKLRATSIYNKIKSNKELDITNITELENEILNIREK